MAATATTDRPGQARGAGSPRARAAGPRLIVTAGGALGGFLLALALLAWQMSAGRDPALGPGRVAVAGAAPHEVLVRHVVITRVRPREVIVRRRTPAARPAPAPIAVIAPPPSRAPVSSPARPAPRPAPPAAKAAPVAAKPAPPTTHQS